MYWDYRIGKRVSEMCLQVGLPPADNAVLYLILDIVGFGVVNAVLEQDSLNRVWKAAKTGPPPDTNGWPPSPTPRQPRPAQA